MKRIYTILTAAVLGLLLLLGVIALFGDSSAQKPTLSFASLTDGSYYSGYQSYYSGKFSGNESLKSTNTWLNGFYRYSGLSGDVGLILDMNSNAADHGESLKTTEPPSEEPDASSPSASTPSESTEEPSETTQEPTERVDENDVVAENLGQALLVGDRAIEVPYGNYDIMESYSDAVSAIASSLGSGVRTFSILVPNAAEFYAPNDYHTGDTSQSKMIGFCYEKMDESVLTVDAYSKLADHTDEYIYFRTDHHWTQLGAYYAYTAFCETAGLEAEPLSKFETGQYDNFVGSMYNFLSAYPQASVLYNNPDTLYYYRPFVDTDTSYYADASLNGEVPMGCISYIGSDVSNKYLTYLGGDHPITIINTDVEGPVCMLLKESYGNAFAPWLTSHYSKVIVIDPREFNRDGCPSLDLAAFAKEQNVSDCIVLNYPMMISSESYTEWLSRLAQ